MKPRLRKLWFLAHLYLGLTVGVLFVLLGLTGSVIVFDHDLDEWLNPGLLRSSTPHRIDSLRLATVVATAEQVDSRFGKPTFLLMPRHERGVFHVSFVENPTTEPIYHEVTIDPSTGEPLGSRVWGNDPVSWIYKLHYTLHLGVKGSIAVGIGGILLLISALSGVVLWWPILQKGGLVKSLRIRRARLDFDLHKAVGAVSALLLVVIAFTGTYMIFPEYFRAATELVMHETGTPKDPRSTVIAGGTAIDADAAVRIAEQAMPGARFRGMQLPTDALGVYVCTLARPGEVRGSWGACQVWVDQYSGAILGLIDSRRQNAADVFHAWMFPLHNGEAFGLAGRWIVAAVGIVPLVLFITGLRVWWAKRNARRRQAAGKAVRTRSQPAGAVVA